MTGRAVWDDVTPREDLVVLEDGVGEWNERPDVLVVGGGIVGLSVAVFCRRRGMRVLLVERGRLAQQASGRAGGGLAPDAHPEFGEAWHALARASLALHRELDAEWDYGIRTVDVLIRPDFRISDQGHVNPLRLAAAFARHAGDVNTRVAFSDWETDDDRVVRVLTTKAPVAPGCVVVATGIAREWTDECWVKGHLLATEPAPFGVSDIVSDGEIGVFQLPDGRLVVGGTKDREDQTEEVDPSVVERIHRRLIEFFPEARDLQISHRWCCFRPCVSDELPVIDLVPGLRNVWIASGLYSTGLLMGPVVGRLVSEWIAAGRPHELVPFGLNRLRPSGGKRPS